MALRLGLSAPSSGASLLRPTGATQAAGSARSRALRVANQAGWQNPRETSPSRPVRVRAIAAPERIGALEEQQQQQRQQQAAPPPPPAVPPHQVRGAANAILPGPRTLPQDWRREAQERREALERLMQQETEEEGLQYLEQAVEAAEAEAAAAEAAVAAATAAVEERLQAQEAAEQEAQLRERLAQAAAATAATTSGRGQQHGAAPAATSQQQQQQQQQQQRAQLVPSTRRHRLGSRAKVPAAAAAGGRRGGAGAPAPPATVAAADMAAAATVRTWLLDCSSRRARGSRQPMAAAPAHGAVHAHGKPGGSRRLLRGPPAAAQPGQPPAAVAAVDGLSEETQADMQVLLNTRLQLSASRRCRKGRAKTLPADAMSSYFRSLGNTPVLGRAQEARLAGILQKGRQLEALASRLAGGQPGGAPGVDLGALAAAAGLRGAADAAQVLMNRREAKDLLMQYNVRLVINVAKRYANNGIDLGDLIPEGMVGLSKSLDRFEPSKGFKFSTYAHWWIRQSISRAVCDQSRDVRLPSHVCEILYRINRAVTTMMEQPDRDEPPGYDEIATEVGLPVQRVIQYLRLAKVGGGNAADRPASYLSGANLKEVSFADLQEQEGDDLGAEEEEIEAEERFACMRAVTDLMLGTLDKRERNILRMRYGLLNLRTGGEQLGGAGEGLVSDAGGDGGGATMSLGEVAVAYGLSKERIRQIEDKAMRALRKPWRMQLVRELSFGHRITPGSLSEWEAAQEQASKEGLFLS
ncbi:hypothetical protein ABPG75_010023 [Micractinium tetrahymenae]